jgi:hypothetical protein
MKLTWDDVLLKGRLALKFQVKIPKIAYSTGVPKLAHFLALKYNFLINFGLSPQNYKYFVIKNFF